MTGTGGSEESLIRGYSGRLLLAVSAGWLAIQAGRLVLSPMLPAIRADLGLSGIEAGAAFTVIWGLYAILQYPSGRLSDALSRNLLLVSGLLFVAVGFTLVGVATTYPAFLFGAVVVGLGAGLYPTAARALVSDLFVERRGRAFGLHTASGDLGGVAAAGVSAIVLAIAIWRVAYIPIVIAVVTVASALHFWVREDYVVAGAPLEIRKTARRLSAQAATRRLLIAYTLYAFVWQAATGFLPTYLRVGKDLPPWVGTVAFGLLFGVGVLVKPTAGLVSDQLSRARMAPAVAAVGAVALLALVIVPGTVGSLLTTVVFAAGLMAFPPVMQAHLMDTFPTESAGGDLGAMRSVYIGLGSIGPTYVGAVADLASFQLAFLGLAILLGTAALLAASA